LLATLGVVTWIYIVIEVLSALALIFLILMHSGKGGGLREWRRRQHDRHLRRGRRRLHFVRDDRQPDGLQPEHAQW